MAASLVRLKTRPDFLRVAAMRRKWAAPGLILQAAPVPQGTVLPEGSVRVGFTASKKVGNAVARNRARRRMKAAVDEVFPAQASPGLDYVVICRRETIDRPYSLLVQDLLVALKRVVSPRPPKGGGGAHGTG